MGPNEKTWLENRLHAAVDDDFYLDRDEEKRIKEEGASRGISIREIELTVQADLKKTGAVSERQLLDELDRMLHQFTDQDRYLDPKEERDAFDHVVRPAAGKRKGLDPKVAEDHVASFCKVNGIRRSSDRRTPPWPLLAGVALVVLIALAFALRGGTATVIRSGGTAVDASGRSEIDGHLGRADEYIQEARYTDPPERSAKAELDEIAQIDPDGGYRHEEVDALRHRIVEHYFTLAEKSARAGDKDGARQWLGRARLLKVDEEEIGAKARQLAIELE